MIHRIIAFCLQQRLMVIGAAVFLAAAGVVSFEQLPVQAFPDVQNVFVQVVTQFPGQAPEEVEKLVTLPDTHHAHHGMGRRAHMRGNYAVTLFLFDTLLGTARIPRARQERFGLPGRFDWREEMLWPVIRRRAATSGTIE